MHTHTCTTKTHIQTQTYIHTHTHTDTDTQNHLKQGAGRGRGWWAVAGGWMTGCLLPAAVPEQEYQHQHHHQHHPLTTLILSHPMATEPQLSAFPSVPNTNISGPVFCANKIYNHAHLHGFPWQKNPWVIKGTAVYGLRVKEYRGRLSNNK